MGVLRSAVPDAFQPFESDPIRRAELAIADIAAGNMVILCDDEDRENEGDLVIAAEKITPEAINFMATHARGLICLSLTSEQVFRLGLPMMASHNTSVFNTAFTVSIEAREGVTTGISAADRAHTTRVAIHPGATPRDIVVPGHMFPLRARDGGVLERVGQTEGSVDLARLAGLNPAGVICEIMNPDGSMARMPELLQFGAKHGIRVATVADLIKFRMRTERVVKRRSEGQIEIPGLGSWNIRLYESSTGGTHVAVWTGGLGPGPTLVRVQAAPPPWAFLAPDASALAASAHASLAAIREAGAGVLVAMHNSPGDAAISKVFATDFGDPNELAPTRAQADALRDLGNGCQILLDLGLHDLCLLTTSRRPIIGIEAYGLRVADRIPLAARSNGR
jgi:3,4-dihydroxy 2-butanone 4-phosphate synthase/GTP cyclohydrolase II